MTSLHIENQLFPSVTYLAQAIMVKKLVFCPADYYAKMGGRNRYSILSAQGSTLLSVPLQGGRDQRKAAGELLIDNQMAWQRRHWRTLVSAYNRSPFFEYYAPSLQQIYDQPFLQLWDFNQSGWHLVNSWLGRPWEIATIAESTDGQTVATKVKLPDVEGMPGYQQVFGNGFVPNLSILDALFNLGRDTRSYLENVYSWLTAQTV